jgi:hypothetical protein
MFFAAVVLLIQNSFDKFLLVMRVASTCLANCFSISWNVHSKAFDSVWRFSEEDQGVVGG